MGRPEEPLARDGSPVREFAFWLRDLRNRSGQTYQQLARVTNYGTSTMQAAAAGRTLPTLKVTMAFVAACRGDRDAWRKYWMQIKRALDTDSPRNMTWPIAPAWARGHLAGAAAAGNGVRGSSNAASGGRAGGGPTADRHVVDPPGPARPYPAIRPRPTDVNAPIAPIGWYVVSFSALLRLDRPQPEAVEHRVIEATEGGLHELATSISVPRHPDDREEAHQLEAELLYGGSLELREQPYESYFRHVITLATPLNVGERHEYQLLLRLPPGQPMAPHYVYVPLCRSDHFALRVRFDPGRLPKAIWVLSGTPTAVIYERAPNGTRLLPDRFGEVGIEFDNLKIGLGYGVRWQE